MGPRALHARWLIDALLCPRSCPKPQDHGGGGRIPRDAKLLIMQQALAFSDVPGDSDSCRLRLGPRADRIGGIMRALRIPGGPMTHTKHLHRFGTVLVAFALAAGTAGAEPAVSTYDIASYKLPPGFTVTETAPTLRKLTKIKGSSYCAVTLLAALPSAGAVEQDLAAEWKLLRTQLELGEPSVKAGTARSGWKAVVGTAQFAQGANSGRAVLTTYSAGGKRFSVLLLTNNLGLCSADYRALLGSLVLPRPDATAAPAATAPVPNPPAPSSPYHYNTTTFQEGWTSTQHPDWVQITNSTTTVRLHYPIAFTDETRRMDPSTRMQFWWNRLVAPRYRTAQLTIAPTEAGVGMSSFAEADTTEVGSNRAAHVALLATSENGSAYVIEIVAPDVATVRKQFPTYDQIKAMAGFNKFQVDPRDLRGTWENSSSAYGMYYSTADGSFAGMRGASVYDKFVFSDNGRYTWEALGVTTGGGVGGVSQGTEKGTFKLSAWEATATHSGKTTQYLVQFEAIRGGRLLVLQNKQASALRYVLAKTK